MMRFLKHVFRLSNMHGALITMPHKIATLRLVDEASVIGEDCRRLQRGADRSTWHTDWRHVSTAKALCGGY